MSARLDTLARDKELLLMRSALCRLRLRRQTHDLRNSLPWNRSVLTVATSPALRRIGFGLAVSFAGLGRTARLVALAGRLVLLAKLARSAIGFAH